MPFDYDAILAPAYKAAGIDLETGRTSGKKKTEGSEGAAKSSIEDDYVSVSLSDSSTGNEDADEAINKVEEQLTDAKEKYEKQIEQCYRQIQSYQQQLSSYDAQIRSMSASMYGGAGDSSQIANTLMQLTGERNKIYDNINVMLLNIQEIEDSLADAQKQAQSAVQDIMNSLNSGDMSGVSNVGNSFNVQQNGQLSTSSAIPDGVTLNNTGSKVIDNALKYDDKSQSQMSGIMQNAGSAFHTNLWCADFVSHVLKETYGKEGVPGNFFGTCPNTSYCPTITDWAKGNGSWTTNTDAVKPGDLVLFDWDGDKKADHVGFFISKNADGSINTIEGNTSGSAGSSCVEAKRRAYGTVLGYSRLSALS